MTQETTIETPYCLDKAQKSEFLLAELSQLTAHHAQNCAQYGKILEAKAFNPDAVDQLANVPFIPVRLFKMFDLSSISKEDTIKVLTSSGTMGAQSKIFLDKKTAIAQSSALIKIMQTFLGKKRLPMLIIDHASVIKDRNNFSARGAGIRGMANFGADYCYALEDEDMSLNLERVRAFMQKHDGKEILIFGFTFMVWQYFVQNLKASGERLDLSKAILIHSGGWKKLVESAVSNEIFKATLKEVANISRVHNFYGMVEQVGSVFVECSEGFLHAPNHADVIVRDPIDWSIKPFGEEGIIEVLSCLPHSYPGHALLTEDVGVVYGEDDCKCTLKGKYFKVNGRIAQAEVRGCSDTHQGPAK